MRYVPLGELLTPARARRAGSTDYPVLSMTMHAGLVTQTDRFKKRIASQDTSDYKVVENGQLVVGFPINEGVLDFQLRHEAAVVSPAYGIWDVRDESMLDRPYLQRYLTSPHAIEYYVGKMKGSTARRRSLPPAEFAAMPIPLPSVPEQRRIASILDRVDAIRARRRQILAHLDLLAQALFHDMFDARDQPGQRLDTLIDPDDRINYGVVQPGESVDGGVPLVRVSDLRGGSVVRDALKKIDPRVEQSYARSRIRGTEILVSSVGSIGTIAVASPADIGSNVARAITRVPISDPVTRTYVAAFLRTAGPQRYFRAEARVVAQPTLNVKQLAATLVPVPPPDRMQRFAELQSQISARSPRVQRALAADDELFASIQCRAFRGEL